MFNPNLGYVLLFVTNPAKSAEFYKDILLLKPIVEQPDYYMFRLPNGIMLGLWERSSAEPKVEASSGSMEICFPAEDVDSIYNEINNKGITIAQKPTDMDFGRTFVFLDPDGQRVRVYKLHKRA